MKNKITISSINKLKCLGLNIAAFMLLCINAYSQNIAINATGAAPNASAMLDITSTSSGLLIPRMTSVQRTAIAAPATGLLVYDTTTGTFWYYDGTAWVEQGWQLKGNTLSGNEFIGSLNSRPFIMRTNNTERMRIHPVNGEVTIGLTVTPGLGFVHDSISYSGFAGLFENARIDGRGLMGRNVAASGTNTNCTGVTGTTLQSQSFGGLFANGAARGTGIFGAGNNVAGTYATAGSGASLNGDSIGTVIRGLNAVGTGLISSGNGVGYTYFNGGSGATLNGTNMGVGGNSTSLTGTGGYFQNPLTYAYVGVTVAGFNYKINGTGLVATIVENTKGEKVNLVCPEAPEALFQDYGEGQLQNGFCHIDLDPDFAKNITVNAKHPLRVMIQLNDDCNGVYVANRSATGFDIRELNNGTSNAKFTWSVTANRADEYNADAKVGFKYSDLRFPPAALRQHTSVAPAATAPESKVE